MTIKMRHSLALLVACAGATASACGGSSSSSPSSLTIAKAATANGDNQTDTVLSTLPTPLRVVVNLGSTPKSGESVTWATSGAGASVNPLTTVTDANGIATTTWTLGHTAGTQTATATLAAAAGSPLTFSATATPGAATQLILPTGDGQQGMIGVTLATPLTITVDDQYGNGVAGVVVAWQVTSGSGSVSPTNATSGASGVAQTMLTLGGSPGAVTITATNASLSGSPQTFHATAQPIPMTADVTVGPSIAFTSTRNNSQNPAVDTIAVGGTVTWTWAAGSIAHSVQSTGSPSFASSATQASGTYAHTFTASGSYHYDCIVHGASMSGIIVVR